MNIEHHIEKQLKTPRLGGFIETLDLRLKQAQQEELDHLTFLQVMLQDEIERREAKKLTQRLSRASFEEQKSLEGFDFSFNTKIKRSLVKNLATCIFIEKKEHILIYGPAGVGKTTSLRLSGMKSAVRAMMSSLSNPLK